ncbi:hypothetical protein PR202_ga22548 [Eleusine coracana subsp. coracana]|uniref:F-box domain-containing protein n=1 Tax=Eleusine coracana subsp. coracana TaxID=191504 RepID=A0AAV5D217_ELECO|nr:hypothetical protein PR202_ga22548 [Eleusine coracana subsp. coracana]
MTIEEGPPPPWSTHLPPEIAAAVLRHIPSHADRIRFAAVCSTWRAATASQQRPSLPWLLLPDGTFYSFPASFAAFQFPSTACYHGSCDDWLLLDHDQDGYQLQSPFLGETMWLPGLNCVHQAFSNSVVLAWTRIITVGNNNRFPNDHS